MCSPSAKRQAGAEIEVTDKMAEAGALVLSGFDSRFEELEGLACRVWGAMNVARRPSPPSPSFPDISAERLRAR